jgi:hypothetical protein
MGINAYGQCHGVMAFISAHTAVGFRVGTVIEVVLVEYNCYAVDVSPWLKTKGICTSGL